MVIINKLRDDMIAFVFPGQGSQYAGMARDFISFPLISDIFSVAQGVLGTDIKDLCLNGSDEELQKTTNTQTAIFVVNNIIFELLKDSGIEADIVAGHSLGEYNALVAAGAIGFEDGLALVAQRARLMQEVAEKQNGAMMAILGLSTGEVVEVVESLKNEGTIGVANYNCPGQIIISGEKQLIQKAGTMLKQKGAKGALLLAVAGAFHTSMMQDAENKFAHFLKNIVFKDTKIPMVSNSTAEISSDSKVIKKALLGQMTSPVLWEQLVEVMQKAGVRTFIEVGPKKVLTSLVKRIDNTVRVLSVEDADSLTNIKSSLVAG